MKSKFLWILECSLIFILVHFAIKADAGQKNIAVTSENHKNDSSSNNGTRIPTLGDLDKTFVADVLTILISGTVHGVANCTKDVDASRVTYWIVKNGSLAPLEAHSQINRDIPIVYIIHGWGGNKDVNYTQAIWKAYEKSSPPKNLIIVDYGAYVDAGFLDAVCNLPAVSLNVAEHVCGVKGSLGIDLGDVHFVGHSLGAQVSGLAGQRAQNMSCGKLGRITALDPAGVVYQGFTDDDRLDKSDAKFVDVIHTNMGQYGFLGAIGHIDFYPNCGVVQPGCLKFELAMNPNDLLGLPLHLVSCNHQRSCYLFAESIEQNAFRGENCPACGDLVCVPNLLKLDYTYMGESCRKPAIENQFLLFTHADYPFAEGPVASPDTETPTTEKPKLTLLNNWF